MRQLRSLPTEANSHRRRMSSQTDNLEYNEGRRRQRGSASASLAMNTPITIPRAFRGRLCNRSLILAVFLVGLSGSASIVGAFRSPDVLRSVAIRELQQKHAHLDEFIGSRIFQPLSKSLSRAKVLTAATVMSSFQPETLPTDDEDEQEAEDVAEELDLQLKAVSSAETDEDVDVQITVADVGFRSPVKATRRRKRLYTSNPAMGDVAFLRKRTSNLLKLTSGASGAACSDRVSREAEKESKKVFGGNMKTDQKTFHFLIDAWAFSGEKDGAEQAKRLLTRMEELRRSEPERNITPNVRSYTKAINAISRTAALFKNQNAGQDAESILTKMSKLSEVDPDVEPNTYTYTAVIEAYANSGAPGSAQKAFDLCETMVQKYKQQITDGNRKPSIIPTSRAFNAAITAFAKCEEPGSAEKAQTVFQRLEELYRKEGISEAKPMYFNYNALISAWANTKTEGSSAQLAEEVLERMEKLYKAGDEDVKPTTVSFNSVIDAYAKSGEEGAAAKAEQLLRHMEDLYESGEDVDARPNVRSFNSVINAWAKSGHEDSARRAQEILDFMEKLYESGNENVRPDAHSFCTVINAWARSNSPSKAERAQSIFREMVQLYEAGNSKLRPNAVAFNAVLNACAFTPDGHDLESGKALEIAHKTLKEMEQSPFAKPDQVTYGTFLKVCANQMPESDTRQQLVEILFKKCVRDGQVGNLVLKELKAVASPELYSKLVLGRHIDDDVRIEDLPKEWRENVVEGRWRRQQNHR